ncbi:MAG: hypothetical protein JWQ75_1406 [Pseudarthrobacter sp.]|nr:hypothetical protein [Pseudarthrobacter sp.]
MMKRIRNAMSRLRRPPRAERRAFNADLLDRQREDVFVLLHQQLGGLR